MIGEASTLVNQYNIDRVYKENTVKSENKASSTNSEETASGSSVTDTVSLSSEALAKSRQVEPAEGTAREEQMESEGGPKNLKADPDDTGQVAKFINTQA